MSVSFVYNRQVLGPCRDNHRARLRNWNEGNDYVGHSTMNVPDLFSLQAPRLVTVVFALPLLGLLAIVVLGTLGCVELVQSPT